MCNINVLKKFTSIVSFLFLLTIVAHPLSLHANEASFSKIVETLNAKSFDDKSKALDDIAATGHENVIEVLNAYLDGKLFYIKKTKEVGFVDIQDKEYEILSVEDKASLGKFKKRKVKKISINNKLRSKLKGILARLQFSHPDEDVRLSAVKQISGNVDEATYNELIALEEKESSEKVKNAIATQIALYKLKTAESEEKLSAIDQVTGDLDPAVRAALASLAKSETEPVEVQKAAQKALSSIEDSIKRYQLYETIFFGLSLGSILVLAAVGLAITFGVMGVINMAHGELMMLGAYTTYVIQQAFPQLIEYSLLMAIPAAFLVAALVGIAIERGIIRFLYGRPLETLLATFGVSLILQQAVRSIFSPLNRSVITPEWMSGSWEINSVLSLTYNRLYILIFSLLVFAALVLIMRYTRLGLQVRAVSQNRSMAKAMGVRSEWVDAMTFGLGSGIAGVAGVALSQLTNVGPNLGQAYIVDSFMVVVFGGVGNIWGTLVSGLSLGVVNKFIEPYAGAVMAKILILVFIILFIQKRPRGLFPQKGRAAED